MKNQAKKLSRGITRKELHKILDKASKPIKESDKEKP